MLELLPMPVFEEFLSDVDPVAAIGMPCTYVPDS